MGDVRALLLVAVLGLLAFPLPTSHADPTPTVVVDQDVDILVGVPDEIIFSPPNIDQIDVPFTLSSAASSVEATLTWDDPTDIDFEIFSPTGASTGDQGKTLGGPESATLAGGGPAGSWKVSIYPFATVATTAHLHVVAYLTSGSSAPPLVTIILGVPSVGALDTTDLFAGTSGGTPPYTNAWDSDNDGTFETTTDRLQTSFAPGDHLVRLRVTDAASVTTVVSQNVHVWSEDHELSTVCGAHEEWTYWSMEFAQTHGTCWIHDGHNTYFFDDVYSLSHIYGRAFAVEQQFAPGADSDLRLESSMDGVNWTEVGRAHYVMVDTDNVDVPERQEIQIDVAGAGQHFRYMRIHSPPSLSQGLSGYLDFSLLQIVANDVSAAPAPTHSQQTRALPCETSLMERFVAEHPCTYGGIDRWDSVSIYHTYVAGDGATLDNVTGNFTLLPFRADDFTDNRSKTEALTTLAYLYTSVDGRDWTLQATIDATYGMQQSFAVDLGGQAARFVRLFPEYHGGFDTTDHANFDPLHHPRAFFLHSAITIEGMLPDA